LRPLLHGCGLDEVIKWRTLCYARDGKNIAIIQEMKAHLALMFFKGALLEDPKGLLRKPGKDSHVGRRFEFTSAAEVTGARDAIENFVGQAIQIEKAGRSVPRPSPDTLARPAELDARFSEAPALAAAFAALTPGRQRGYLIFFNAPKSSAARERRITKCAPKILAGKGWNDR